MTHQGLRQWVRMRFRQIGAELRDRGSTSLEQIAWAVGLLTLALVALAVVTAVVNHYTGILKGYL